MGDASPPSIRTITTSATTMVYSMLVWPPWRAGRVAERSFIARLLLGPVDRVHQQAAAGPVGRDADAGLVVTALEHQHARGPFGRVHRLVEDRRPAVARQRTAVIGGVGIRREAVGEQERAAVLAAVVVLDVVDHAAARGQRKSGSRRLQRASVRPRADAEQRIRAAVAVGLGLHGVEAVLAQRGDRGVPAVELVLVIVGLFRAPLAAVEL